MIKIIFLFLFSTCLFSQKKEKLRFFVSEDSLWGVKNNKGKIIIPAEFNNFFMQGINNNQLIKDNLIFFISKKNDIEREPNSAGFMYDRKGNFLFQPFLFDNGPDYFEEGLMRFVKNGKIGFADKNGKIIIEAKNDFASPFFYGYSQFCNNCHFECYSENNCEHKVIVGGEWGIMNKKGIEISPLPQKQNETDVEIRGKYYPNPFVYNKKELEIIDFFRKQELDILKIYSSKFSNEKDISYKKVYFEIVDYPKENYPFYEIYMYNNYLHKTDIKFLVSENNNKYFFVELFSDKKIPFSRWIRKEKRKLNRQ